MDKESMAVDGTGKVQCPWCPTKCPLNSLHQHMRTQAHAADRKERKITVIKWNHQSKKDNEAAEKQNKDIADRAADNLKRLRAEMRTVGPNEHGQLDATRGAINKFAKAVGKIGQPQPSRAEQTFKKQLTSHQPTFEEPVVPMASTSVEEQPLP